MAFGAYGVTTAEEATDPVALAVEEIALRGFTVLPDVLTRADIDDYNAAIEQVYAGQCAEVGGEENLARIGDIDIVRCLLAYDNRFLAMATSPRVMEVVRVILGDTYVLIMQNGVVNRPDRLQAQTKWHRDLNYQHWVNTQPLALSALVCLEDFTDEMGGTVFLPASHKSANFPSQAYIADAEYAPTARAGSVILFDSMIFHRAGVNRSNRVRRAVNHVYGRPILAQQIDIPAMLNREAPADPWLAAFLGYRWNPVHDVAAWRQQKIRALGA
jgi:ectoine hydroxylase-related dioxygenase (phytanoyl-CoA dioxygenase family)